MRGEHVRILLLVLLLAAVTLGPSSSGAAPALVHDPAAIDVIRSETLEIAVQVNAEAPPLGCFALTLQFDPTILRLIDAQEGALFAQTNDPTFFSLGSDPSGAPVITDCVLGFQTTVTPPGELVVLRFEALQSGSTLVGYDEVVLRDVNRAEIEGVEAGFTAVQVEPTATPADRTAGIALRVHPNPSSSLARIELVEQRPDGTRVSARSASAGDHLEIFDLSGRRVRELTLSSGASAWWDGRDRAGREVSSGIYFVRLRHDQQWLQTKLVRVD